MRRLALMFTLRSEGASDRNQRTRSVFKNSEEEKRAVRSSDGDVSFRAAANY